MPYIWILLLGLNTAWAFAAEPLFGWALPFAKTDGGWLIGMSVLSIGTCIALTIMNMIEEKIVNSAAAEHDHH